MNMRVLKNRKCSFRWRSLTEMSTCPNYRGSISNKTLKHNYQRIQCRQRSKKIFNTFALFQHQRKRRNIYTRQSSIFKIVLQGFLLDGKNIPEELNFYLFPEPNKKKIQTTNYVESINRELKQRTKVIVVSKIKKSCLC